MSNKNTPSLGLALILGALAGYLIGLLTPDKTHKSHKKQLLGKTKQLNELLTDPDNRERVIQIFEKYSTSAASTYSQTQEYLITNLSKLKGGLEEINKQKYQKALLQAIDQIKNEKKLPEKQIKALKKYLQADYQILKDHQLEDNS